MGGKIKIGLIVFMLVAMLTATAAAQNVTRTIVSKEALPGQVVTVELTASQNLGSPIFGEVLYLNESFPGTYINGSVRCIEGCDGVEYNESLGAFVVIDLPPLNETKIEYSIITPTTQGTYFFNGTYQEFFTNTTGNIAGDNTTTVVSNIIVKTNVTEVTWGLNQSIEVNVTTPHGYPVNVTVSIKGAKTEYTYATNFTGADGRIVFTIRPSPLDEGKGGLIVYANYTYDNKTITNQTTIDVIAPPNITYIYATARIEGTTNVLANKRIEVTYRVDNLTAPLNYYGVLPNNTTDRGEFLLKFPTPNIGEQHDYYIYITPVPPTEQKGKYVNVEYHTVIPGYVRITYGTTSVQANVPVRATVEVVYPDNLVVQVFNDLSGVWSNNRTCCEKCIDTPPKRADGVSKFKVRAQLRVGNEPYNLTDLENALAELGITSKLPDYVHVCVNDTKIAVIDENGQRCADIKFVSKDNSTAIFYVRSNAPTDPSKLKPENTGIVNITGWYNYTVISGTEPANNVPEVNNLTDYDCADFEGTGFIAGEVVDGETQHSIPGAKVYVKWFNRTASAWVNATDFEGNQIVTTSDEHGHYKLEVISGRTYKVYAEKEGYKGCAPSQEVYVQLGTTTTADVVLVKNSTTKPDLTVESIDVGTPVVNETVTVKAKIANVGDADAGAFNVRLYADGSPVDTKTVESLTAGNSTTVEFNWTPDKAKTYELKVVVDTDNAVDESNENNNEKTESVTVVSVKMGDANGDGKVTVVDAMFIAQYVAGIRAELPNPAAADVRPDGEINVIDAMFIAQYIAGLRPSLG